MDSAGLEVDRTRTLLLQNRPEDQYPKATPVELPRATTSAPEIVPGPEKEVILGDAVGHELPSFDSPAGASSLWRGWKLWLLLIAVVIAFVFAVAEAAGMQSSKDKDQAKLTTANHPSGNSSSSPEPSSNASVAHILSASGALNGTALTTFNVDHTNIPTVHIFYQDYKAQIRRLQKIDSTWFGGPNLPPVYSDSWFGKVMGDISGLRIYYGVTDKQVHETAFSLGSTSWSFQSTFNGTNSNAGVSGPHAPDQDNGDAALFMIGISKTRSEHGP